ncbi:MAG: ankyrin-3-like [Rickettsiaceae bacterium]|jgi:ankyrin repeat protein|nr:ankyrin-3-like [Rickettsiaceae bacterium]
MAKKRNQKKNQNTTANYELLHNPFARAETLPKILEIDNSNKEVVQRTTKQGQFILKKLIENKTKFLESAENGDKNTLEKMLEKGVDIKTLDKYGDTALHIAIELGYTHIIEALLKRKDIKDIIDLRDHDDLTPLHHALLLNDSYEIKSKIVTMLIRHGANLYSDHEINYTPYKLIIYSGLIKDLPDDCQKEFFKPHSLPDLFLIAAYYNDKKLLSKLLNIDKNLIDTQSTEDIQFIDTLDPNEESVLISILDESVGWTTLHIAVYNGHFELVKFLVKQGACLNIKDKFGITPLHMVIEKGHVNIFSYLIENKASLDVAGTPNLLEHAIEYKQPLIANLLIKKGLKAKEEFLKLPLDNQLNNIFLKSIKEGKAEITIRLLEMDVNLYSKNKLGESAFSIAYEKGYNFILKDIVWEALKEELPNYSDNYGKSLLHYVTAAGYIKQLERHIKADRANMNVVDKNFLTLMHEAAKFGHTNIIDLLIKNGFDVNAQDNQGKNPLDYAFAYSDIDVVAFLIYECKAKTCNPDISNIASLEGFEFKKQLKLAEMFKDIRDVSLLLNGYNELLNTLLNIQLEKPNLSYGEVYDYARKIIHLTTIKEALTKLKLTYRAIEDIDTTNNFDQEELYIQGDSAVSNHVMKLLGIEVDPIP